MPWTVVEASDEDGEELEHVIPIVLIDGFKTKEEASDFLEKCKASGDPVLVNDDDNVIATYFGHTLSRRCVCGPRQDSVDCHLYVHNQSN